MTPEPLLGYIVTLFLSVWNLGLIMCAKRCYFSVTPHTHEATTASRVTVFVPAGQGEVKLADQAGGQRVGEFADQRKAVGEKRTLMFSIRSGIREAWQRRSAKRLTKDGP